LSDFGWSNHTIKAERKTFCGTLDYLCPEMLFNNPYDFSVDIWCLGILCFEFCTGHPPFESQSRKETFKKIKDIDINYPSFLSYEVRDLINKLLQKIPKERLNLEQVLDHPWIVKYRDYIPQVE